MRKHALLFISLLTAFACVREETVDTGVKTFDCFTVAVEESPMTKVHMEDGGAVKWDVGDCIGVYSDTQAPVPYYRGDDGKFYGEKVSGTKFYAFYPYSSDAFDLESPLVLKMMVNHYGSPSINLPMVAQSADNYLLFKQTCGIIHIAIKSLSSYSMTGLDPIEDREYLGGIMNVSLSQETPSIVLSKPVVHSISPFFSESKNGVEHLYFLIPPTCFSRGFVLWFTDLKINESDQGVVFSKKTRKEVSISRGEMLSYSLDLEKEFEKRDEGYPEERDALISFYTALDGDNWVHNENWCSEKPLQEWFGIRTDVTGHVEAIILNENRLRGVLPDAIGALKSLRELDLTAGLFPIDTHNDKLNILTGTIPDCIWELQNLERLELNGNSFSGSLPESIGHCVALEVLELGGAWDAATRKLTGYDYLSGVLPEGIGRLRGLYGLDLQNQDFEGEIPSALNGLRFRLLHLNNNRFTGPLPDIEDVSDAVSYLFNGNDFSGSIPSGYANLLDRPISGANKLSTFWIDGNRLSGPLPKEILSHPNFPERAYDFMPTQQQGYKIDIEDVPASRYVYETLDGGFLNLGEQYGAADYTMIVRWTEWCSSNRGLIPLALDLAKKYEGKGLQVIWAYGGGDEIARRDYMTEMHLDQQPYHIVECHIAGRYGEEGDHYVWLGRTGYYTPFFMVVDREGKIVFVEDNGYNYRPHSFANEQGNLESFLNDHLGNEDLYVSTDTSLDGVSHTLQTATKGAGINIVIMGDAFSDRLINNDKYRNEMQRTMDAFFSEEPFKSFKDYFNVYYVNVVSKNEVYYGERETALNTFFGEGSYVAGDDTKVFQYAQKVLSDEQIEDALIIVLLNRNYYAGTCFSYMTILDGDYGRGPSIAYFPTSSDAETFNGMVLHEAGGHGFAKLADEYEYVSYGKIPDEEVAARQLMSSYGWNKNVDFTADSVVVKWAPFITDTRYADEHIGVYEGACTFWTGAWRPTEQSIMRHNTGGYNAPSRYAIWYRINKLAYGADWIGTYEDFVTWDLAHRAPASTSARSARPNFVEKEFQPLAPPVVVKKDWREVVREGKNNR